MAGLIIKGLVGTIKSVKYNFNAALWLYPGDGAWVFISLPKSITQEIKAATHDMRRGFGSVRVQVTLRGNTWDTSILPDTKSQTFLLPIKKSIRQAANLNVGDVGEFSLQVKDV